MQRPVEADRTHGRNTHQPDNARRPPYVCNVGADKGCRHIHCEQDARTLQRSHDREIRPGAPDKRNQGLRLIEIDTYFSILSFILRAIKQEGELVFRYHISRHLWGHSSGHDLGHFRGHNII